MRVLQRNFFLNFTLKYFLEKELEIPGFFSQEIETFIKGNIYELYVYKLAIAGRTAGPN